MKTFRILPLALLAVSQFAFAADEKPHTHGAQPRHGGLVVEASHLEFELLPRADRVVLHVRDHGKPVDLSDAKGTLTVLAAGRKTTAPLVPAAGGTLEAQGAFGAAPGTRYAAAVAMPGRASANVLFAAP